MRQKRTVKHGQPTLYGGSLSWTEETPNGTDYHTLSMRDPAFAEAIDKLKSVTYGYPHSIFVLRNETRRGVAGFWYAYRKIDGKTLKRYIGKAANITSDTLRKTANWFLTGKEEPFQLGN